MAQPVIPFPARGDADLDAVASELGVSSEAAAHALLRMVGDFPGQMGRLRAARVVSGYSIGADQALAHSYAGYCLDLPWPLRETVALVDALIEGHLLAQTPGPRPTLVLTRAGHRALDALEAV